MNIQTIADHRGGRRLWISILVFLELAPGRGRGIRGWMTELVSILVFLELAPGPLLSSSRPIYNYCFNPCFSGTRARTTLPTLF